MTPTCDRGESSIWVAASGFHFDALTRSSVTPFATKPSAVRYPLPWALVAHRTD